MDPVHPNASRVYTVITRAPLITMKERSAIHVWPITSNIIITIIIAMIIITTITALAAKLVVTLNLIALMSMDIGKTIDFGCILSMGFTALTNSNNP